MNISIRKHFSSFVGWVQVIGFIAYALCMFFIMLAILDLMWPITTIFVVGILTMQTFERKLLGIASIGGSAIYASSWPMTDKFGLLIGLTIWSAGVFLWFWSICRSFQRPAYIEI